ncbi:MAG: hypothetical protein M1546_21965 [Chloroflexi bacterium]|nr:hypothetical protein [Chloroflexota bacterium]
MKAVNALKSLGPIDAQSVRRDSFLRWMLLFPFLIALLLRLGVPPLAGWLAAQFNFDVTPYYPLLMSLVVLFTPMMFGMLIGFLLLDQRDDHTLTALQVTPLTLKGYLVYRTALPVGLSVVLTMLSYSLSGLVPLDVVALFAVALAAAPLAPLFALCLAALAGNKVQGFALTKGSGGVQMAPLIAYFVPWPWQLVFGLVPSYWPVKLYWALQANDGNAWVYLVVGLAYQAVLLYLLLRRFDRVMTR